MLHVVTLLEAQVRGVGGDALIGLSQKSEAVVGSSWLIWAAIGGYQLDNYQCWVLVYFVIYIIGS
jgi:hypothetical protein